MSILDRLRAIAERRPAPVPEPPPPKPKYRLMAAVRKAPVEPPSDVPRSDWSEAQRNVTAGSAPCLLTAKQLAVNDKVFTKFIERAVRQEPAPKPYSLYRHGPTQAELRAQERSRSFPTRFP
jgi:hypothetical protein